MGKLSTRILKKKKLDTLKQDVKETKKKKEIVNMY